MGDIGLPLMRELYERQMGAREPRRIRLTNALELSKPLPPTNWLVPAIGMGPGAPCLVAGYGFSGKTMALQSLALSVATGKSAWGVYSVRRGRVVHLDYEQGAIVTNERYQRLAVGMGIELADLGDQLRVGNLPDLYLDDPDGEEAYAAACEGAALVIVDSYRACAPSADENSSDARKILDRASRISDRTGATLVFIHHARKPGQGERPGGRYQIRGSSALYDACDTVFCFSAEKGEPTQAQQSKARRRGITSPDFWLRIEDVASGANPRAGLRLVHLDREQVYPPNPPTSARPHCPAPAHWVDASDAEKSGETSAQRRNRTADTGIFNPDGTAR